MPANDHLLDKSALPGVKAPAAESSQADGKTAPSPAVLSMLWTQVREHKVVQWALGFASTQPAGRVPCRCERLHIGEKFHGVE